MRSLLADQEANELQEFVDDIKDALQMFMVSGFPSEHTTPFISMTDIPSRFTDIGRGSPSSPTIRKHPI